MNIYEPKTNYDIFQLVLPKDIDVDYFPDTDGEPVAEWKTPTWALFAPKAKDKKKRTDFNASLYYPNIFLLEQPYAIKLISILNEHVEAHPVNIENIARKFFYINITKTIHAINEDNLTMEESLDRARDNKLIFIKKNIENEIIFRDDIYHSYYCTDKFIEWVNTNNILGLNFIKVGEAY